MVSKFLNFFYQNLS